VQRPATHVACVKTPPGAGQALPHVPQFALSDVVSRHTPLQICFPAGHTHALATHDSPGRQALPQEPQFAESVA
jgi:hypothetical protein